MTDNGTSGGANTDKRGFVTEGYDAGLRGLKGSPYDGGHRVPFFLRWPEGGLHGGKDIEELTANVVVMPTLLDLCGIEARPGIEFHGKSLKPLLNGTGGSWEDRALVTDSQRVVYPVKWRQSSVMTNRWRLINGKELYDVTLDRGQERDVAERYIRTSWNGCAGNTKPGGASFHANMTSKFRIPQETGAGAKHVSQAMIGEMKTAPAHGIKG